MQALNIVVAGAGMGGLTAALALQKAGHRVHVYERVAELAPVGAAISIWSNGVKILNALGLKEQIEAVSGDMRSMSYQDLHGQTLTRFSLEPLYQQVQQPARPIARAVLQELLLEAVGREHITLGVSCEQVAQDATGIDVTLSTGDTVRADLLVAADGTHSRLRTEVAGFDSEREYRGYVNWNGRVPVSADLADAHEWKQFVGEHKRVSLMPMGNDEFYFFFDVPLPKGTANQRSHYRDELRQHFAGWAEPVQTLIERIDPERVARVEIHDVDPLDRLVKGRLVLLGDAAHSMTPDLGQGGCQAMEDAWVLMNCLEQFDGDVAAALQQYEAERLERVAGIVLRARKRCDTTHGTDPDKTQEWYDELAQESGVNILAGLRQTIEGSPLQ
ncbi:FAD-dependent urate hydroxylase HpxO [Pokkaliibacter sp. MBI-7]|uniref:FAD-dependent urate hydroxylase HpxO n=1 Tax=Pokkaliibacter sp. MBI-7 TaxID=3040600 RepID=UPI00244AC676|nr:FAD-dependent urate hydroxylase HpxO [Pokkaliibacter sp. MBI-7]MDH2433705.1 FAD-dependent urate hydroxylase HpxO [Pokkaliibacter sp. MBI-7]